MIGDEIHELARIELTITQRELRAFEDIADGITVLTRLMQGRNRSLEETVAMQREHLDIARHERDQRDDVATELLAGIHAAAEAESVRDEPRVDQREPGGLASPRQGVGTDSVSRLFAILRDPATAPSGWINQVKHTYGDRDEAVVEAQRLASQHGGRFLVLEAAGYVEAHATFHLGLPSGDAELADLPF